MAISCIISPQQPTPKWSLETSQITRESVCMCCTCRDFSAFYLNAQWRRPSLKLRVRRRRTIETIFFYRFFHFIERAHFNSLQKKTIFTISTLKIIFSNVVRRSTQYVDSFNSKYFPDVSLCLFCLIASTPLCCCWFSKFCTKCSSEESFDSCRRISSLLWYYLRNSVCLFESSKLNNFLLLCCVWSIRYGGWERWRWVCWKEMEIEEFLKQFLSLFSNSCCVCIAFRHVGMKQTTTHRSTSSSSFLLFLLQLGFPRRTSNTDNWKITYCMNHNISISSLNFFKAPSLSRTWNCYLHFYSLVDRLCERVEDARWISEMSTSPRQDINFFELLVSMRFCSLSHIFHLILLLSCV